jgi:hypothetical protein
MNPLQPLQDLIDNGQQPVGRMIWLGLGIKPRKQNPIEIDPANLPSDDDCKALAGLDVVLSYFGHVTRYGTLQRLCESIYQARPRRLQVIDHDYRKIAFLKIGGHAC